MLLVLLFLGILWLTGGHFAYSLDDPYIHLALAENLPFNYSINARGDEAGAPSSSILYPYLLMPLAHTSLAGWGPLLLNIPAVFLVLALLLRLFRQLDLMTGCRPWQSGLAVTVFASAINLFGLVFTGMEHTLHLAAALAVLSGLLEIQKGREPPSWFWLAIILGPLLRYEALALSIAALVYAARFGHAGRSALVLVLTLAGPVAFGFYLHMLGYDWLPGSVLAKSAPLTTLSEGMPGLTSVVALLFNFVLNFNEPTAWAHTLVLLAVGLYALRPGLEPRLRGLLWAVAFAGLAHLLLGKFGWSGRYHPYILAVMVLALVTVMRIRLWLGMLIVAGSSGLWYTAITPPSAAQIWRYHATLHDFLVEQWQDKVAAYDIGYMAWQNPHAVVDLFGLGSQRVRHLIRQPDAARRIPELLGKEHVGLIIAEPSLITVYHAPEWQRVGELQLHGRRWVTGTNPQFYATSPEQVAELRRKLEAFRPNLPDGVELRVY